MGLLKYTPGKVFRARPSLREAGLGGRLNVLEFDDANRLAPQSFYPVPANSGRGLELAEWRLVSVLASNPRNDGASGLASPHNALDVAQCAWRVRRADAGSVPSCGLLRERTTFGALHRKLAGWPAG